MVLIQDAAMGEELSVVLIYDPAVMKDRAVPGADHRPYRGDGQGRPWY